MMEPEDRGLLEALQALAAALRQINAPGMIIGGLAVIAGKTMDLDKIRSFVEQFAEILEDPQRPQEFNQLVRRAMGSR